MRSSLPPTVPLVTMVTLVILLTSIFSTTLTSSVASADEAKNCVVAASTSTTCCQSPLTHEELCLDAEAKVLNKKVRAAQDAVAKPSAGIRDSGREGRAQAQALKDSAALNSRVAETCERLANSCVATCRPINSMDAANAVKACVEHGKIAAALKAQAERDTTNAKRR